MRRQIVQRFLRPRAVWEVGNERAHERDVLRVVPELADGAQIEVPGFGDARSFLKVRTHAVTRRRVIAEAVIGLGDAQVGNFPGITAERRPQCLEGAFGFRVAAGAEEHLRPTQVGIVTTLGDQIA